MTTQPITLQLPPELLAQAQAIAGSPENLQDFVIRAIEHEIERTQPNPPKSQFWQKLEQLRAEMQAEGIEINPDEIWGDVRDRSPGREVTL
ncbi:hypothetical protein QPK87_25400 [Kamptonema cortianum]|nr:hypothetical protein [Kamptonema cortianum]